MTALFPTLDKDKFEQVSTLPLFFIQTNNINRLINAIYQNSLTINQITSRLPGVARSSYLKKLLPQEIFSTNEIEGVKTSKNEIETVVGELKETGTSNRRLVSSIILYTDILNDKSSSTYH